MQLQDFVTTIINYFAIGRLVNCRPLINNHRDNSQICKQDFKKTPYNSDGLINCLLQPGLFYHRIQKSMREESNRLIKSCATRTVPAAETKSIGLQADAQLSWFLLRHLDNFIMTPNARPPIGT